MNQDHPEQARQVLAFVHRYPTTRWWRAATKSKQTAVEYTARLEENPEQASSYRYVQYEPATTYPNNWNVNNNVPKLITKSIAKRFWAAVKDGGIPDPAQRNNGGPSQTPTTPRTGPGTRAFTPPSTAILPRNFTRQHETTPSPEEGSRATNPGPGPSSDQPAANPNVTMVGTGDYLLDSPPADIPPDNTNPPLDWGELYRMF